MGSQERKNDQRVIRQFASSLFGNIVCIERSEIHDHDHQRVSDTNDYSGTETRPRSDPRLQLSVVTPKTSIARLLHRLDQCGEGGRVRNQKGWRTGE